MSICPAAAVARPWRGSSWSGRWELQLLTSKTYLIKKQQRENKKLSSSRNQHPQVWKERKSEFCKRPSCPLRLVPSPCSTFECELPPFRLLVNFQRPPPSWVPPKGAVPSTAAERHRPKWCRNRRADVPEGPVDKDNPVGTGRLGEREQLGPFWRQMTENFYHQSPQSKTRRQRQKL